MVIDNPKRHHPCEQPKPPYELIMLDVFGIILHCSQFNEVNYLERYPSPITDNADFLWKMVWRHQPRYASSRSFNGDYELYESDMTKLRLFIS